MSCCVSGMKAGKGLGLRTCFGSARWAVKALCSVHYAVALLQGGRLGRDKRGLCTSREHFRKETCWDCQPHVLSHIGERGGRYKVSYVFEYEALKL